MNASQDHINYDTLINCTNEGKVIISKLFGSVLLHSIGNMAFYFCSNGL
jgi:hypothetical protein